MMSSPPADPKPKEVKQEEGEEPSPKPKREDEKSKALSEEDASSDYQKYSLPPPSSSVQLSSSETKAVKTEEAVKTTVGVAAAIAEEDTSRALVFDKLGENDVLLGRGAPLVKVEGNCRFRMLIQERQNIYMACTHHSEKEALAKEVLEIVASRKGRFWKRVDGYKELWIPVDSSTAMEKVKQAYRDVGSKRKPQDKNHLQQETASGKCKRNKSSLDKANAIIPHQVSLLRSNAAQMLSQNSNRMGCNNPASSCTMGNNHDLALFRRAQEAEREQMLFSQQMALMQQQHEARNNPMNGLASNSMSFGMLDPRQHLLLERHILAQRAAAAEHQLLTQQLLVERQLAAQASAVRSPFMGPFGSPVGGPVNVGLASDNGMGASFKGPVASPADTSPSQRPLGGNNSGRESPPRRAGLATKK